MSGHPLVLQGFIFPTDAHPEWDADVVRAAFRASSSALVTVLSFRQIEGSGALGVVRTAP
jgi:hypothetical protein